METPQKRDGNYKSLSGAVGWDREDRSMQGAPAYYYRHGRIDIPTIIRDSETVEVKYPERVGYYNYGFTKVGPLPGVEFHLEDLREPPE